MGTYILIITLNVNGLNAPTKRHRLAEWIQKPYDNLNRCTKSFRQNSTPIYYKNPPDSRHRVNLPQHKIGRAHV